ncbi:MAG: type 1 glutamine amidotransferase domain-containing protein [Bacillota bacterium]|nr:type 1 glutamine amidotransferase domain-containing protein [Bacillota bacterium]
MSLHDKRIAIFLEQLYEDPEFWYPYYRFIEAGAEVTVIAPEAKEYKSKYGYPALADISAAEAKAQEYDAVIIPGGYSPDHMRRSDDLIRFLKEAYNLGKVIAAICHGPWMLASIGAANGKKVTSFYSIKDDLVNAGAQYLDQEVVRDGNIITSRMPRDLPAFCREVIKAL